MFMLEKKSHLKEERTLIDTDLSKWLVIYRQLAHTGCTLWQETLKSLKIHPQHTHRGVIWEAKKELERRVNILGAERMSDALTHPLLRYLLIEKGQNKQGPVAK